MTDNQTSAEFFSKKNFVSLAEKALVISKERDDAIAILKDVQRWLGGYGKNSEFDNIEARLRDFLKGK